MLLMFYSREQYFAYCIYIYHEIYQLIPFIKDDIPLEHNVYKQGVASLGNQASLMYTVWHVLLISQEGLPGACPGFLKGGVQYLLVP